MPTVKGDNPDNRTKRPHGTMRFSGRGTGPSNQSREYFKNLLKKGRAAARERNGTQRTTVEDANADTQRAEFVKKKRIVQARKRAGEQGHIPITKEELAAINKQWREEEIDPATRRILKEREKRVEQYQNEALERAKEYTEQAETITEAAPVGGGSSNMPDNRETCGGVPCPIL